MAEKTLFFVQPYVLRKHKLQPDGARTFRDGGAALEAGAALAARRTGIVVMSQTYDTVQQKLNRPCVLRIHGRVPTEWVDARQAA